MHCLPGRDTVVYQGPAHDPDPHPAGLGLELPGLDVSGRDPAGCDGVGWGGGEPGRALGFDATRKEPGEVVGGSTPEELVMSADVQDLVTRRWGDYGLSPVSRPAW
jgi:hypothetical protein